MSQCGSHACRHATSLRLSAAALIKPTAPSRHARGVSRAQRNQASTHIISQDSTRPRATQEHNHGSAGTDFVGPSAAESQRDDSTPPQSMAAAATRRHCPLAGRELQWSASHLGKDALAGGLGSVVGGKALQREQNKTTPRRIREAGPATATTATACTLVGLDD